MMAFLLHKRPWSHSRHICASKLGEDLLFEADESFDPSSSSTSVNVIP